MTCLEDSFVTVGPTGRPRSPEDIAAPAEGTVDENVEEEEEDTDRPVAAPCFI
jgi:hypothetical protein